MMDKVSPTVMWWLTAVLMYGPALFALWRLGSEDKERPERSKIDKASIGLALAWTTAALFFTSDTLNNNRGYTKTVCRELDRRVGAKHLSDDQWNEYSTEEWWIICHPEDAPEKPVGD